MEARTSKNRSKVVKRDATVDAEARKRMNDARENLNLSRASGPDAKVTYGSKQ